MVLLNINDANTMTTNNDRTFGSTKGTALTSYHVTFIGEYCRHHGHFHPTCDPACAGALSWNARSEAQSTPVPPDSSRYNVSIQILKATTANDAGTTAQNRHRRRTQGSGEKGAAPSCDYHFPSRGPSVREGVPFGFDVEISTKTAAFRAPAEHSEQQQKENLLPQRHRHRFVLVGLRRRDPKSVSSYHPAAAISPGDRESDSRLLPFYKGLRWAGGASRASISSPPPCGSIWERPSSPSDVPLAENATMTWVQPYDRRCGSWHLLFPPDPRRPLTSPRDAHSPSPLPIEMIPLCSFTIVTYSKAVDAATPSAHAALSTTTARVLIIPPCRSPGEDEDNDVADNFCGTALPYAHGFTHVALYRDEDEGSEEESASQEAGVEEEGVHQAHKQQDDGLGVTVAKERRSTVEIYDDSDTLPTANPLAAILHHCRKAVEQAAPLLVVGLFWSSGACNVADSRENRANSRHISTKRLYSIRLNPALTFSAPHSPVHAALGDVTIVYGVGSFDNLLLDILHRWEHRHLCFHVVHTHPTPTTGKSEVEEGHDGSFAWLFELAKERMSLLFQDSGEDESERDEKSTDPHRSSRSDHWCNGALGQKKNVTYSKSQQRIDDTVAANATALQRRKHRALQLFSSLLIGPSNNVAEEGVGNNNADEAQRYDRISDDDDRDVDGVSSGFKSTTFMTKETSVAQRPTLPPLQDLLPFIQHQVRQELNRKSRKRPQRTRWRGKEYGEAYLNRSEKRSIQSHLPARVLRSHTRRTEHAKQPEVSEKSRKRVRIDFSSHDGSDSGSSTDFRSNTRDMNRKEKRPTGTHFRTAVLPETSRAVLSEMIRRWISHLLTTSPGDGEQYEGLPSSFSRPGTVERALLSLFWCDIHHFRTLNRQSSRQAHSTQEEPSDHSTPLQHVILVNNIDNLSLPNLFLLAHAVTAGRLCTESVHSPAQESIGCCARGTTDVQMGTTDRGQLPHGVCSICSTASAMKNPIIDCLYNKHVSSVTTSAVADNGASRASNKRFSDCGGGGRVTIIATTSDPRWSTSRNGRAFLSQIGQYDNFHVYNECRRWYPAATTRMSPPPCPLLERSQRRSSATDQFFDDDTAACDIGRSAASSWTEQQLLRQHEENFFNQLVFLSHPSNFTAYLWLLRGVRCRVSLGQQRRLAATSNALSAPSRLSQQQLSRDEISTPHHSKQQNDPTVESVEYELGKLESWLFHDIDKYPVEVSSSAPTHQSSSSSATHEQHAQCIVVNHSSGTEGGETTTTASVTMSPHPDHRDADDSTAAVNPLYSTISPLGTHVLNGANVTYLVDGDVGEDSRCPPSSLYAALVEYHTYDAMAPQAGGKADKAIDEGASDDEDSAEDESSGTLRAALARQLQRQEEALDHFMAEQARGEEGMHAQTASNTAPTYYHFLQLMPQFNSYQRMVMRGARHAGVREEDEEAHISDKAITINDLAPNMTNSKMKRVKGGGKALLNREAIWRSLKSVPEASVDTLRRIVCAFGGAGDENSLDHDNDPDRDSSASSPLQSVNMNALLNFINEDSHKVPLVLAQRDVVVEEYECNDDTNEPNHEKKADNTLAARRERHVVRTAYHHYRLEQKVVMLDRLLPVVRELESNGIVVWDRATNAVRMPQRSLVQLVLDEMKSESLRRRGSCDQIATSAGI